jgi:hypothetical protein
MDTLIGDDGTVDVVCDPHHEIPLEVENVPLTLGELLNAMSNKRSLHTATAEFQQADLSAAPRSIPIRKAA